MIIYAGGLVWLPFPSWSRSILPVYFREALVVFFLCLIYFACLFIKKKKKKDTTFEKWS